MHCETGVITIVKNAVREFRTKVGLTQEELAQKIDVTRQTIGLIEKEKYNPTISLALKLCEVLNTTLNSLFWMEAKEDEKR